MALTSQYNHGLQNNFPGSIDSEKFFKDFNDKVQRDWSQMCEQSRREMQDWARRNNVENFPNNFPMSQLNLSTPDWPKTALAPKDNSGCGRLIGDVRINENGLALALDVSLFAPEELKVTTVGNELVIEGQHDQNRTQPNNRSSEHRQFYQKYTLPDGCNPESVTSQLSNDGVLTVTAPTRAIQYHSSPRAVPIQSASVSPRSPRLNVSSYY